MYRLTEDEVRTLGYDLDAEIVRFIEAREAHKLTEGVPAPTTFALVEEIVKRHGGAYYVGPTKEYVRIVDGVVLDRRKFDRTPIDAAWSPRSRDDQNVGYVWDDESGSYLKPGVPRNHSFELQFLETQRKFTVAGRATKKLVQVLIANGAVTLEELGLTDEERAELGL